MAAWDIAFNFAIYGGVFYDKLMAVWVVATVILLAMLLSGQRTVLGHWGILMLLLPTGWFMFIALSPAFDTAQYADDCDHHLCDGNRVVLLIFALLFDRDGVTYSAKYRNRLILIVLFVVITGYLVGTFHQQFVSCQQFQIAGHAGPADCASSEFWQKYS
jgi:hypothetical protein